MPSVQIQTSTPLSASIPPATSATAPLSAIAISTDQVPALEPEQPHATSLGLAENVREVIMENQVVINTFIAGEWLCTRATIDNRGVRSPGGTSPALVVNRCMKAPLTFRGPGGSYESDGSLAPGASEDHPVS